MVDCFQSMLRLEHVGHRQLPPEYRGLLTFDESPADMCKWMAVNLSAPTIPIKTSPEPATRRRGNVQVVRSKPATLPFGRLERPRLRFYKNSNTSASARVAFEADSLHVSTLKMLSIPYMEKNNANVSLTVQALSHTHAPIRPAYPRIWYPGRSRSHSEDHKSTEAS